MSPPKAPRNQENEVVIFPCNLSQCQSTTLAGIAAAMVCSAAAAARHIGIGDAASTIIREE